MGRSEMDGWADGLRDEVLLFFFAFLEQWVCLQTYVANFAKNGCVRIPSNAPWFAENLWALTSPPAQPPMLDFLKPFSL